ncbi:MAG TPA: DUF116 domain-containing protein [Melioribacteraceae bacterium]|nr:DUF116 domain-containing protein [Melioribacteraceae bacterium]
MRYLTYNLQKEITGINYYETIKLFVDELLYSLPNNIKKILGDYKLYLTKNNIEDIRSDYEYIYDLMFVGVSVKLYYPHALKINKIKAFIFNNLIKLRKVNSFSKEISDIVRGILATYYLSEKSEETNFDNNYIDLELLNLWLESTNEFKEEVKRSNLFYYYIQTKQFEEQNKIIEQIIVLADSFIENAKNKLSEFTKNVTKFIEEYLDEYKWKEDYIFCGRKEAEYHLSMVGAELLNRAFKEKYKLTKKRALLLPACMKEKPAELCKAKKMGLDYLCTGCSNTCNINKIKEQIKKYNCETFIIPHSSDFSNWLKKWENTVEIGVIGVACPLNLMQGGLELRALNIPSQCVLLDYCGCKNHWSEKGFPTSINKIELFKVIKQD